MKIKNSLSIINISYASWCGIGFIRGMNYYNYKYNKYNKFEKKEDYLYLNLLGTGFYGLITYANPFFLPFTIYKEIYRLEVNVRNLENEKKSNCYNDII
jgi:hypothetical protein